MKSKPLIILSTVSTLIVSSLLMGKYFDLNKVPNVSPISVEPNSTPLPTSTAPITLTRVSKNDVKSSLDNQYGLSNSEQADVYYSDKFTKAPIMVLVHGGAFYNGSEDGMAESANYFTTQGFVSVSIDYRVSADGFIFPTQVNDTACGIAWTVKNAAKYHADPTRIVLYGASAGAHIVAMLAYNGERNWLDGCGTAGVKLKYLGVMADSGPYDFDVPTNPEIKKLIAAFLGPLNDSSKWGIAEPINFIDANDPPALLFYGKKDTIVNPLATLNMYKALKAKSVYVVLVGLDAGHVPAKSKIGVDGVVNNSVNKFLSRILGIN